MDETTHVASCVRGGTGETATGTPDQCGNHIERTRELLTGALNAALFAGHVLNGELEKVAVTLFALAMLALIGRFIVLLGAILSPLASRQAGN